MTPAAALRVGVARAVLGGLVAGRGRAGRAVLAVLAIALGVALGFAVQLINHTALAELTASLATLSGDADLVVQGPRDGFDESLYPALARDPAIAVASPVVEVDAAANDETVVKLLGVDVFRAAAITPALVGEGGDRVDALRPDVVFLDATAQARLGVAPGDTIRVPSGSTTVRLRVAGTVSAGGSAPLGVMDIGAAQDRFARAGKLSRIDLRLRPGFDAADVARRIGATLPAGVAVATPRASLDATARFTRAYRVNLDVLALVALFTGGLLVFSTEALAVLRRRAPFALLRSLGLSRGRLVRLVVAEGAALGIAGALAGLAAGFVIATLAVRWLGVDLGSGFFRGRAPAVAMDWSAAALFGAAGVAAAVLGSLAPAREAARAAPAVALKAGDVDVAWHGRPWLGVGLLVVGAAFTALPPVAELPLFGYAAIALLLLGTLRLLPPLSAALLRVAPVPRAAPAQLALARLRHAPAQSTLSLAALVAAVALMAAMAIMVASFRTSLSAWLRHVLPADVYVRAGAGDSAWFPPDVQARLAALPGVERAELGRVTAIVLDPAQPRVALLARDVDPARPATRLALTSSVPASAYGRSSPAWISEAIADRLHWNAGARIVLPLAGRAAPFVVAGVYRDYARQQGSIVIERRTYAALTGDARVNEVALWRAPGASTAALADAIRSVVGSDAVEVATPESLRATSLAIFDRTFAVTYALEAVAILIGITGLSSAFGAEVLMRRRELGMLRHIGVTRAQVGRMLAAEGLALSGVGVAVGIALGFLIALILVDVVNRQSFHWSMDLDVPWRALGALAAALLALGVLTAWLAGRRAMDDDVVRAVREDW